MFFLPICYTLG